MVAAVGWSATVEVSLVDGVGNARTREVCASAAAGVLDERWPMHNAALVAYTRGHMPAPYEAWSHGPIGRHRARTVC